MEYYATPALPYKSQSDNSDSDFLLQLNSRMKSKYDDDSPANTCPDFWQMIWETKSKMIVMLCEVESGFSGCFEYFPKNQGQIVQHGNFVISNISQIQIDGGCQWL